MWEELANAKPICSCEGDQSEGRSQESGMRASQGAVGAGKSLAGLGSQQAPAAPAWWIAQQNWASVISRVFAVSEWV